MIMTEFGAVIKKEDRYAHINTRITWVDISEATLFSSTYMAGVALKALRDQGFNLPSIIFGFPDCTLFAQSGSQHDRDDAELQYALANAKLIRELGERYNVPWMIENPVGALSRPEMMGTPDAYFHPWEYGGYMTTDDKPFHPKMPMFDGYTKKTCLWFGNGFRMPEKRPGPINIGFFWGWKYLGGKSETTKQLRSLTPRGFARAVFEANKQ